MELKYGHSVSFYEVTVSENAMAKLDCPYMAKYLIVDGLMNRYKS